MRGPDFSEVLESACKSAGIELDEGAFKARSRLAHNTAARLQRFADRILDLGARATQAAASLDSYFEHQSERPSQRKGKPSDPEAVAAELRITPGMTLEALNRLRREYARTNHPDRAHASEREQATRRMMIANMLIDSELKRRNASSAPFKR